MEWQKNTLELYRAQFTMMMDKLVKQDARQESLCTVTFVADCRKGDGGISGGMPWKGRKLGESFPMCIFSY